LVGTFVDRSPGTDITGSWHYRSFNNLSKPVPDLDSLVFGEGDFELDESPIGLLKGSGDFGGGLTVSLSGSVTHGSLLVVRFQATGTGLNNKDWLYDYIGILVPPWSNGVNQVPALVGSVVRSAPHSSGTGIAPAGRTGSFVAVRKPAGSPSAAAKHPTTSAFFAGL
jgi:hypothetical protein